eukprot:TRINITY_DN4867_c0_g1_i4.p1 TRINITY_DN4867_c0_g1~~TRINITY_DN4867_c0_g1_i4.p1  ORF type:complete len:198 (+),score=23.99 TRINITY_DN4867_c0_g1_i4:569-1162(+)
MSTYQIVRFMRDQQQIRFILQNFLGAPVVGDLAGAVAHNLQQIKLLNADPELLPSLTASQLNALYHEILDRANRVKQAIVARETSGTAAAPPEPSAQCLCCLNAPPTVSLSPCLHRCLCSSCYSALSHNRDGGSGLVGNCPVCRQGVLSHYRHTRFADRQISEAQYRWEGAENTRQELKHAQLWDRHRETVNNMPPT